MELQNFFAQDVNGNIVPGALCSLFLSGTTTLATGLQDINNVPMSNPFSADGNALVQFRAPNGAYDLNIVAGSINNTLGITCADNLQALAELVSFLGPHATAPTLRADGTPIQLGDRYFNTVDEAEYLYKSTGWEVNDSLAAIAILADPNDPSGGATGVGWDGDQLSEQMDLSKKLANYTDLRAYSGSATRVEITESGFAGTFKSLGIVGGYSEGYGIYVISSNGTVWERQFTGDVQLSWFEGANDSEIVQRAVNGTRAIGRTVINVDGAYVCTGSLITNRTNVKFVGSGSLSGDAVYRVNVAEESQPSISPRFYDLLPSEHLRKFSTNPSPVVVICGSSTGTWSADAVDTGNGVAALLQRLINKYNPGKNISFYNRCIGGQTFATLNSIPTVFPDWYTDHLKPWLDYVNELSPDLVVVISGSNDSSSLTRPIVKSTIDKVAAFTKANDLVFITQPSVCPDPDPAFASSGTRAGQEGRDYAAGIVRSCAIYYRKGFIDGNRQGGIVLDGRDILDNASMRIVPDIPVSSGRFAPGITTTDFSMSLNFNGTAGQNDAAFLDTSANPVFIKVGADGANSDSGDIAFIQKNSGGFLKVQLFSDGSYQTITTTVVFPTTSFTLDVIKSGTLLTLSFNQFEDTLRTSFNIIAAGGEMYPRTGYFNLLTGPWTSVVLNVGRPKLYKKLLTSIEAWGLPNPGATRQMPYGGNGINHFSSLGTRAIYAKIMDTDALRAVDDDWGEYTPVLANVPATPNPSSLAIPAGATWAWSRTGDLVEVTGVVLISDVDGTCTFSATLPIVPAALNQVKTIGMAAGVGVTGSGFGDPTLKIMVFSLAGVPSVAANVRLNFTYRLS